MSEPTGWARLREIEYNEGHVEVIDKWLRHDQWRLYVSLCPSHWALTLLDVEDLGGWVAVGMHIGPLAFGVMRAVSESQQ